MRSCSRSGNSGPPGWTSTGHVCAPPSRPDASPCPAIHLRANGIGLTPSQSRSAGPTPSDRHRTRTGVVATNGSSGGADAAGSRQAQIEATLQRIWGESLGVNSIDRNDDFFELGGDSLSAISIATNLSRKVWT